MTEEKRNRLKYLFRQFLANRISHQEYAELWMLMQTENQDPISHGIFDDELQWLWEEAKESDSIVQPAVWDEKMKQLMREAPSVKQKTTPLQPSGRRVTRWIAAAAILLLVVSSGIYFYQTTSTPTPPETALTREPEERGILPGGNKAMLILSNGARIILDSASDGIISKQGKTNIVKQAGGRIMYSTANVTTSEVVYNMLTTPRGGKYQITLADGTRVWLDAASSLRYPTSFPGAHRMVEMTGEAYFEVAENSEQPFVIMVDGMKVKVLGTHFNIMAYDDEPLVKATLLEGKIQINLANGHSALLAPGEQAQINKSGEIKQINSVNISQVIAWKNDLFWFDENTIQEVMRQVARWYDADVEIEGIIPQHFTGSIPRNVNVLRVFEVLQETGNIHFKVNDHKIIVTP